MSKNKHIVDEPIIAQLNYNKSLSMDLSEDINKCSMWCEFAVPPVFRIKNTYMMSEAESTNYKEHDISGNYGPEYYKTESNTVNYGKF
jgi:hypothetical protein